MDKGIYIARVGENSAQALHLDEDAVQSATLSRMFADKTARDTAVKATAARSAKKAERRMNRLTRDCARLMVTMGLVILTSIYGLPVALATAIGCTGLMIYRVGRYFGGEQRA